jgi:hypothetical protein
MKVSLGIALALALATSSRAALAQSAAPQPAASPSPSPSPAPSASPIPLASPSATPSPAPAPQLPGGVVPYAVDVQLAGTVTPRFALARIAAAIDALTDRLPGTLLDVHGITLDAPLTPGTTLDALAGVSIAGRGAYLDVNGRTSVHLSVANLPPFQPLQLFYSDDPEYIPPGADGVLFRGTVTGDVPVRLFLYHVAAGVPRRVALVLRSSGAPARVQIGGAAVGPNPEYAFVGQQTTARFLVSERLGESVLIDLRPDEPHAIALGTLQPNDLIEAIEDVRVVSGGPVTLALVTSASPGDLSTLAEAPELPDDSHQRHGVYSLAAIPPIALSYVAGGPEPDPVNVGLGNEPNLRPDGRPLAGDYGVTRRVQLHLANPTATPQTAYLYERTLGGGGATFTMLFDGDDTATIVPCVNDATQPRLIRAFDLPPGSDQSIAGTYMTDGASSYPIALGITLTPPLPIPPGACNGAPSASA